MSPEEKISKIHSRLWRVELGLAVLTALAVTEHPWLAALASKWAPAIALVGTHAR